MNFEVDFDNLNDNIFKIFFKNDERNENESNKELGDYYLIDSDEDTLTIRDVNNYDTIIAYKKHIKKIIKVFSRNAINKQFINVNKNFKNKVCWITTYNLDWCFYY